ncbi:MAG: hypothetical protein M1819_006576 [Sarea resinae]|nr:MAG: hypothetical protein M1819_006576 [Sarea resinae]
MYRRHRAVGGGLAYANKSNAAQIPDSISLLRTFDSETNPARPVRPSPLTASPIQGMPLDLLDRIRSFPLFISAPDTFLAAIGAHLRPQLHSAHEYILTEGDDAKAMYWLVRGAVAVTSRDGESTYAELRPGAFFGEIGILMDIPRTATIVARTRCLLVVLKKEDLKKELPRFPEVERAIREEAQERLTILERKRRERADSTVNEPLRLKKRSRDVSAGQVTVGDSGSVSGEVINYKKRKSPSPGLAEAAASSALGSVLVNVRQLLKELPLFAGLPPEILHFLGLNAQPRTYPPFTEIIRQDSQGREIFFIVRGEVEVVDENSGRAGIKAFLDGSGKLINRASHVKARLKQGQYFGEVTSLSLAPRRTATVRSVTAVECLMITGDVLNELWERCSPVIRQQVEETAKKRLEGATDRDATMIDSLDVTPPINELVIADNKPKEYRKGSVPRVTFSHPQREDPKILVEERPVIEPSDPDPFLNVDLDSIRSRSRRGSLAPPPPEGGQPGKPDSKDRPPSPRSRSLNSTASKAKHSTTPPEHQLTPKRPKIIQRRPSHNSKGILPRQVLIRIFQNLDIYHLMRLRAVSMYWSKLLNTSPDVLQILDLSAYNRQVTDEALIKWICPFIGSRPRLVDIGNCFHITDEGFGVLASVCGANVKSWRMKSVWDITAHAVLEMASKAKGLEEIDLSNCRKVSDNLLARVVGWVVQETPPNIQTNSRYSSNANTGIHPSIQPPAGTVVGCPNLKRLTLSYCKHVTDRSMAHLAIHAASRLEEIDLTRCTTITDQGFQHWGISQFTRLSRLCLADCTYLTDNAIVYLTNAAKGLRELDLVSNSYTLSCAIKF